MDSKFLDQLLRTIVEHYGFARVRRALKRLQQGDDDHSPDRPRGRPTKSKSSSAAARSKTAPKVTAPLYVEALDAPSDIREPLYELAQMYEEKNFLATLKDVKDFCATYGISVPSASSRAASIPRVFRALSNLSAADLRHVVISAKGSRPARLAPIADAIRRNSDRTRATDASHQRSLDRSSNDIDASSIQSRKPRVPKED